MPTEQFAHQHLLPHKPSDVLTFWHPKQRQAQYQNDTLFDALLNNTFFYKYFLPFNKINQFLSKCIGSYCGLKFKATQELWLKFFSTHDGIYATTRWTLLWKLMLTDASITRPSSGYQAVPSQNCDSLKLTWLKILKYNNEYTLKNECIKWSALWFKSEHTRLKEKLNQP